jgi:hypothetical protein
VAARVAAMRERIQQDLAWYEGDDATSLATNLAFVQLLDAEDDARVAALSDAKMLLDMQTIVAMRQASMIAVTTAT